MKKQLYVNGEWKDTANFADLLSPYTKEVIAQIPQATEEEVNQAISVAYRTKEAMAQLTAYERAAILEQLTQLFIENRQKAAEIISLESAKPLKYALGEIDRTIETYKFAAEEAKRHTGEMIPMDAAKNGTNRFGYTIEQPVGVIGAITPFNFPQNLVAHKVGPAIAAGNPIVLKPASQTPLSALFLAELLDQTALPKGAFNVVTGSGKTVGDALVNSDLVKMITFTGSPAVGIGIRNKAGLKKVALELGSNAGLLIDRNVDLEEIIPKCVMGAFSNQGQVCISLQRAYVMEDLYDEFISAFKEATIKLVVGSPMDEATDLSAMIHPAEQVRALNWVEEAVEKGAEVITGGKIENGIFMPTILTNVDAAAKVSCQEVFAPIVIVNRISSIDDGITAINDSSYGLQAGIFTNDIKTAFKASEQLEVGGVMINDIPTYRVDQMPYGGVKESGTGKEGLKYAIQEMTETKLIVWNNN
ncbi:aldehyde dehydrogenase family protein [Cytobacillus horneckiae]|uniref:Aldehyde dehydrogenase n=1 Tax=Cytobacillus horneckiae TaxID=549687 RepID=A0A2N0ZFL2_9BACI|nr:aldehyde dehydrogenase family protein [Cytobacillus horneckiae]MEC1154317.1 aldehyde dehydrogenase family protein [Cytobacillus horneckiae]MED2937653.1 aldehyde dehydrogenase family protein [Cytobacillus horneckiae]PKG28301.1 aldehyde dehydrogenase [Cytobacillus horneckiae]